MDFHAMKRKELQALCKEHKIPANQTNDEMADCLTKLLKVDKEKPQKKRVNTVKPCLKNLNDLGGTDEKNSEDKLAKKVRFSPREDQMFVFEKTNPREMRLARRKSIVIAEEKINIGEMVDESVGVDNQVKSTRTRGRGKKPEQADVVEEKLVEKKKAVEIDEGKKVSRKRASGVADCEVQPLVDTRRQKAMKNTACEAKPVTRRSGRVGEKLDESASKIEQVETVKLPKRKARSDCPVNQEMEKAPTRSLRRNISKDVCGNSVEEVKEPGNGASRVTHNTRQKKLNETVSAVESAPVVEKASTGAEEVREAGNGASRVTRTTRQKKLSETVSAAESAPVVEKASTGAEEVREAGNGASRVTRTTRQKKLNETVSAAESAPVVEKASTGAEEVKEPGNGASRITRNTRQKKLNETVSAEESAPVVEKASTGDEEVKEKKNEKAKVTRKAHLKGDTGPNEAVSATESAAVVEKASTRVSRRNASKDASGKPVEESKEWGSKKARATRTTREQKGNAGLNETVSAAESADVIEQVQQRRSTRVATRRCSMAPGELNGKKSDADVLERGVTLKNKQSRKQENSSRPGKSVEQTMCADKRMPSAKKHVEGSQTNVEVNPLEMNSEIYSVSEAVDIQHRLCDESSALEDNQDTDQYLHQATSPTPLLKECEMANAECKAELIIGSSMRESALTKQPESAVISSNQKCVLPELYSSDGQLTEGDEYEADIDNKDGASLDDAALTLSGVFTEGSKTELENTVSMADNCVKIDPALTSTFIDAYTEMSFPECESGSQGKYQTQLETAIPNSLIVESDADNNNNSVEGSLAKNTESENTQSAESILEECNTFGFDNLECHVSKEDITVHGLGLESSPNLHESQSWLDKPTAALEMSTLAANEPLNPLADTCTDHLGAHESGKNIGNIEETVGVTPTPMVEERSEGIGTGDIEETEGGSKPMVECNRSHKQGLEEESDSPMTFHEQTYGIVSLFQSDNAEKDNVITSTDLEGMKVDEVSDAQLNANHEDEIFADAKSEVNEEEGGICTVTDEISGRVNESAVSMEEPICIGTITKVHKDSSPPSYNNNKLELVSESDSEIFSEDKTSEEAAGDVLEMSSEQTGEQGSSEIFGEIAHTDNEHEYENKETVLLTPEPEEGDNKVLEEYQIHDGHSSEDSENVIPCSGGLKGSPLKEAEGLTSMDNVVLDSFMSDRIDFCADVIHKQGLTKESNLQLSGHEDVHSGYLVEASTERPELVHEGSDNDKDTSMADNCVEIDPALKNTTHDTFAGISLTHCDSGSQGMYQTQLETAIPSSLIVESDADNKNYSVEGSPAKNTESEHTQCAENILEECNAHDFDNLDGHVSKEDCTVHGFGLEAYPNLEFQSWSDKPAAGPEMITLELNESAKNTGVIEEPEGVTQTPMVECKRSHNQELEEESDSPMTYDIGSLFESDNAENDSVITSTELEGMKVAEVSDAQLNVKYEDQIFEGMKVAEVSDAQLNVKYEDQIFADPKSELNEEDGNTSPVPHPEDLSHPMHQEEYENNDKNESATTHVLDGSDEKLILPSSLEDVLGSDVLEMNSGQTLEQGSSEIFSEMAHTDNDPEEEYKETVLFIPEPEDADNKVYMENQIHNAHSSEDSENVVPCSDRLKGSPLKDVEGLTSMDTVGEKCPGVVLDSFMSDKIDDYTESLGCHKQGLAKESNLQLFGHDDVHCGYLVEASTKRPELVHDISKEDVFKGSGQECQIGSVVDANLTSVNMEIDAVGGSANLLTPFLEPTYLAEVMDATKLTCEAVDVNKNENRENEFELAGLETDNDTFRFKADELHHKTSAEVTENVDQCTTLEGITPAVTFDDLENDNRFAILSMPGIWEDLEEDEEPGSLEEEINSAAKNIDSINGNFQVQACEYTPLSSVVCDQEESIQRKIFEVVTGMIDRVLEDENLPTDEASKDLSVGLVGGISSAAENLEVDSCKGESPMPESFMEMCSITPDDEYKAADVKENRENELELAGLETDNENADGEEEEPESSEEEIKPTAQNAECSKGEVVVQACESHPESNTAMIYDHYKCENAEENGENKFELTGLETDNENTKGQEEEPEGSEEEIKSTGKNAECSKREVEVQACELHPESNTAMIYDHYKCENAEESRENEFELAGLETDNENTKGHEEEPESSEEEIKSTGKHAECSNGEVEVQACELHPDVDDEDMEEDFKEDEVTASSEEEIKSAAGNMECSIRELEMNTPMISDQYQYEYFNAVSNEDKIMPQQEENPLNDDASENSRTPEIVSEAIEHMEEDLKEEEIKSAAENMECSIGTSNEGEDMPQQETKPLSEEIPDAKLEKVENSSRKPASVTKTNQKKRSIMIHGTPRRPIKIADMKENSTAQLKRDHLVNATASKPLAARKALGELSRWRP